MNSEFNELEYSFALVREICNKNYFGKLILPPQFISLREEANLGYDVKLESKGRILFIQFKVSEILTNNKAKEWFDFNSSYFRFKIYSDNISHQHNLLLDLTKKFQESVYYVAPLFYKRTQFVNFYNKGNLHFNTSYIKCNNLAKISGNAKHCICYNNKKCYMYSEPKEIKEQYSGEKFLSIFKNIKIIQLNDIINYLNEIVCDNNIFSTLITNGILPLFFTEE